MPSDNQFEKLTLDAWFMERIRRHVASLKAEGDRSVSMKSYVQETVNAELDRSGVPSLSTVDLRQQQ